MQCILALWASQVNNLKFYLRGSRLSLKRHSFLTIPTFAGSTRLMLLCSSCYTFFYLYFFPPVSCSGAIDSQLDIELLQRVSTGGISK